METKQNYRSIKPIINEKPEKCRCCLYCCLNIASCCYIFSPIGCDFVSSMTLEDAILRYKESESFLTTNLFEKLKDDKMAYIILQLINLENPSFFFKVLPTGSLREKLGKYLPSTSALATDYDLMLVPDGVCVQVDSDSTKHNDTPILFKAVTGKNEIPPGYLWLELKNQKMEEWKKLCCQRIISHQGVKRYLSQLAVYNLIRSSVGSKFDLSLMSILSYKTTNVQATAERNGPAVTVKVKDTKGNGNTVKELLHVDFTFALYCPNLPIFAIARLNNRDEFYWPPQHVIEKIKKLGCHVVPKPSKKELIIFNKEQEINSHLSQGTTLEFRYSFSQAELLMSDVTPQAARNAYMALKALIRYRINNRPGTDGKFHEIPSYVLKTILFTTVETTPSEYWERENVLEDLFIKLYTSLKDAISAKTCSMYWNDEINLLADFEEEDFKHFNNKLKKMFEFNGNNLKKFLADDWIEFQRCIHANCCSCCTVIKTEPKYYVVEEKELPCCCQCKVECYNHNTCYGEQDMD